MTPVAWGALGLALLLIPAASPARVRVRRLAEGGRLAHTAAPRRVPPWARRGAAGVAAVVATVAVVGVVTALGGPVLGLAAAAAAATAAHLLRAALRRRARDRRTASLGTAVALLAAELRAGAAPETALAAAADVAPEHAVQFAAAAARCRAGLDPEFTDTANLGEDFAALGHAWRAAATAGTPIADLCGRVAADLADRIDQRRAVAVGLAGARSSAALLAGLPVVGLGLAGAMGAQPLHVLLGTPAGRLLCLAGVGLDAVGLLWTNWLTARADGP